MAEGSGHDVRVETRTVDVGTVADLPGRQHIAVTIFTPDPLPAELSGPGGSSEARWHAARGWCFVACDHLGVGDSSRPAPEALTIESLAEANDATVRAVVESLTETIGGSRVVARLGFGQSMGGCLTIAAQGRHRTFDGIGILGFSAIHTVLPTPADRPSTQPDVARGRLDVDLETSSAMIGADTFRHAFFWDDAPADLVERDLAGYPLREGAGAPAWASPPPPCAIAMLSAGVVAGEAALVDVPVLVGAGARDTVPDPDAEPSAYPKADVTVFVAPQMAHMHNFATTRELLWARSHAWGDAVARGK